MKVALIGGNSFIARAINDSDFFRSFKIYCYGRRNLYDHPEFHHFDYPSSDFSFFLGFDLIVNCLGVGVQSNIAVTANDIYKSNTFFPVELMEFFNSHQYKGTLITFGSYFEIGDNEQDIEFTEIAVQNSMLPVPNDYCISKRLLTKYVSSKHFSFNFYHLILPSVYGFGENKNRIIPYTINSILNSGELEFSKGEQIRQFLHVDDLVDAIKILVVDNVPSGIYNVASGDVFSIKDLILCIGDVLNYEIKEDCFGRKITRDTSLKTLKLNGNKLYSFGFLPKIEIRSGILGYF